MEALLAVLLLASFSVVIGYYVCFIADSYMQNKLSMQAIDCANKIAHHICMDQSYDTPASPFSLKVEHSASIIPQMIAGPMLVLAPLEIKTVAIAWKGVSSWRQVKLATITTPT